MRRRFTLRIPASLIAATAIAALCGPPAAIGAQQAQTMGNLGSGGGQITEGPANPAKPPTLATLKRFAGSWSCSVGPVATSSFEVSGRTSPQDGTFVLQSPTTVTHFTRSAGSLAFTRTSTAGGTVNYALSSYARHGADLVFSEANPSAHGGSAPSNTFTPTFEIRRDANVLLVTAKSPNYGTLDYSCTRV